MLYQSSPLKRTSKGFLMHIIALKFHHYLLGVGGGCVVTIVHSLCWLPQISQFMEDLVWVHMYMATVPWPFSLLALSLPPSLLAHLSYSVLYCSQKLSFAKTYWSVSLSCKRLFSVSLYPKRSLQGSCPDTLLPAVPALSCHASHLPGLPEATPHPGLLSWKTTHDLNLALFSHN